MFLRKLLFATAYVVIAFGGVLFVSAGTWRWWRAWVLVGLIATATATMILSLRRNRQALLNERLKGIIQKGQPRIDRVVILLFLVAYSALLVFTSLDVFHYQLLPNPWIVVSSLGLVLIVVGYWIITLVFRENEFAVPVVKHQQDRHQVVVDTGPYRTVRHPMYVGVILMLLGIPLWLESFAGTLFALVPIALLVLRILIEERFLRRELSGYEAYTKTVHYRLVPYVW